MYLSDDDFKNVIKNSVLFSFDLIIHHESKYLLGYRVNAPAKGYWFVPGGRIRKGENLKKAFLRILKLELGILNDKVDTNELAKLEKPEGTLFNQIYLNDNNFNDPLVSTHYIAFGIKVNLINTDVIEKNLDQHSKMKWLELPEILTNPNVHINAKAYFKDEKLKFPIITI